MGPLVTVYITTHNRGAKLTRAVMSVVKQTYNNIEIIISDDGSSDDTENRCRDLCQEYEHITYVKSDVPMGANHARNKAVNVAKGLYITGLDDDDEFLENRIDFFLSHWNDHYSFICDNFVSVYGDESIPHFKNNFKKPTIITTRDLLLGNHASNQIFTKLERLKSISGFNETLKKLQDWDCWLRLCHAFGDGVRLNGNTYLMHHDETIRVSNNQLYDEAFYTLIKNNEGLYKAYFNQSFINRNLTCVESPSIIDLVYCKNLLEVKYVLNRYRIYSLIKKVFKNKI